MTAKAASAGTIRVRQVRSLIGSTRKQREVLRTTLGLKRINAVVELEDSAATRGAVKKIEHLVEIVDGDAGSSGSGDVA